MGSKLRSEGRSSHQGPTCMEQDNGLLFCVVEDFPYDGFVTGFADCPSSSGASLYDCDGCGIIEGQDSDDRLCNGCAVCSNGVAFDCSNIKSGSCALVDCDGNCRGNSPNPPPAPTAPPVGGSSSGTVPCYEDQKEGIFCVKEGYPNDGFETVLLDCPSEPGATTLNCGRCAILPTDDTPSEIDLVNDEQCNSCTVCSDGIAFDCTNLASGDCSKVECGGACTGGDVPAPTAPPPTNPPPTNPPPPPAPTPGKDQPQLTQQCVDEFGALANDASVSAANEERGNFFESQTGQCAGLDTCTVNYTPIVSSYDGVCVAAGGQTLPFSYSISCPNVAPLVFQSFPLCTGASCDADEFISAFIAIREDQLEEDGLTGCVVERVEENGTSPSHSPTPDSHGSTLLSKQCISEIQEVADTEGIIEVRKQAAELAEMQISDCSEGANCRVDYTSLQSVFQLACEQEAGLFVAFDYSITCPEAGVEFISFPDCIGTSCDVSKYYTAFEAATEAALVEEGVSGCMVEVEPLPPTNPPPTNPPPMNPPPTNPPPTLPPPTKAPVAPTPAPVLTPTASTVSGNCQEQTSALAENNPSLTVNEPDFSAEEDCATNAGQFVCSMDVGEANPGYEQACQVAGGQYIGIDTSVTCALVENQSSTFVFELLDAPVCLGMACDLDTLDDGIEETLRQGLIQGLESDGTLVCSGGTAQPPPPTFSPPTNPPPTNAPPTPSPTSSASGAETNPPSRSPTPLPPSPTTGSPTRLIKRPPIPLSPSQPPIMKAPARLPTPEPTGKIIKRPPIGSGHGPPPPRGLRSTSGSSSPPSSRVRAESSD